MTTESPRVTEEQMVAAAKEALESMGRLGTLPICEECGEVGHHDHSPLISPVLTLAALIGLAMVATK